MTTPNTIIAYHGTSAIFPDSDLGGRGHVYYHANDPAFSGLWVAEDRREAESYLTGDDTDRVYTLEVDITDMVSDCERFEGRSQEVFDRYIRRYGVTGILDAEGEGSHVLHGAPFRILDIEHRGAC